MKKLLLLLLFCCFGVKGFGQVINASPTSLSFGTITVGSSSSAYSIALTASYLSPSSGTLTVSAPAGYMVSGPGSGSYAASFTISYTSGTIGSTTIYVRFYPFSSSVFSDHVTVSGGGASPLYIPVYGIGGYHCTGTPAAGTVSATAYSVCGSAADTLTDVGGYVPAAGVTCQWQSSATGSSWSNISGATNSSLITTVSSSIYYRYTVTCSYSSSSASSASVYISGGTCPVIYSAPTLLSFPSTTSGTSSSAMYAVLTSGTLTPSSGNLTVTAPSNFLVSNGSGWVSYYTIPYTGGVLASSTVSVQFNAPATAGAYSGDIAVTGGGSAPLNIHVDGVSCGVCTGTPTPGMAIASTSIATTSTPITLTDIGYSGGSGITLQWQSSPTGTTYTDISGATSATYTLSGITASTYYRCMVICGASGAAAMTYGVMVTYVAPCSGTPSAGIATSVTTPFCAGCTDTLLLSGYSSGPDISFQWQRSSTGSSGWTNLGSALSSPMYPSAPAGDNYFRCAVTCAASAATAYSSVVHVTYHIVGQIVTDSPSTTCYGPMFHITANDSSALLAVKTLYGDGLKDSILFAGGSTTLSNGHYYDFSGAYTVKQVLYFNNNAEDSNSLTYNYSFCRAFPISFFVDVDSSGTLNGPDHTFTKPITTIVDSDGITIDTVFSTSGFYYRVTGPAGTIYSFRPLSSISCPASGVIYDTVTTFANNYVRKYFGVACTSTSLFNLCERQTFRPGPHRVSGTIYIDNSSCSTQSPVVTLITSPKYGYSSSTISPTTVSGGKVTWNLGAITLLSPTLNIHYQLESPTGTMYTPGDTVHSSFTVSPETGDADTTNNHNDRLDTIRGSYDPNFIQSTPSGYIAAGTLLHYSVGFENDGNDTAQNIYVLDTLSGYLDAATFRPVFASNEMYLEMQHVGGLTIVKFDFPGIKLLDSTHHGYCDGAFQYDIRVKDGVPDGTVVPARVGIYFDDNEVVMTNEEHNIIGFPSGVQPLTAPANEYEIYPNPATNELTVKMEGAHDAGVIISNSMGTTVLQQDIHNAQTKLNIKALPAGIYYIKMTGAGSSVVRRFVKM